MLDLAEYDLAGARAERKRTQIVAVEAAQPPRRSEDLDQLLTDAFGADLLDVPGILADRAPRSKQTDSTSPPRRTGATAPARGHAAPIRLP